MLKAKINHLVTRRSVLGRSLLHFIYHRNEISNEFVCVVIEFRRKSRHPLLGVLGLGERDENKFTLHAQGDSLPN